MINSLRAWVGTKLIYAGVRTLPAGVRTMVTDTLLYHVPGMLTEERKAQVARLAAEYKRRRAERGMAR